MSTCQQWTFYIKRIPRGNKQRFVFNVGNVTCRGEGKSNFENADEIFIRILPNIS